MKNKNYFILLVLFLSALQIKAQYSFDNVLYGAAYYHEYMPYERLDEDIRLMKRAGLTVVRVGESAWGVFEPQDGTFEFEWMDRILDKMHAAGIKVILGTPTYSIPAWLAYKHPEVLAEHAKGNKAYYGIRQNMDFTNPTYQFYCERIIRKMLERYAQHPAVIGYQVDNETEARGVNNRDYFFGFRNYIKQKFNNDLNLLAKEWGMNYWGMNINTWEEFYPRDGVTSPSYKNEWERYNRKEVADFLNWQCDLVNEYKRKDQFVTHCFMPDFHNIDQVESFRQMQYPAINVYHDVQDKQDGQRIAYAGDFVRTVADNNYIVMETNELLRLKQISGLMERFQLTEIQSRAIVEMRLRQLTGLMQDQLHAEYEEIQKQIAYLEEILVNDELCRKVIKDELIEVKEKYGDERRSEIVYSSEEFNPEDFYADDEMIITISHMGYIKRTPLSEFRAQNRGGVGSKGTETRDADFVEHIYPATMHNTMMFFTQKGKCYWLKVYEIPEGTKNSKGRAIQNLLNIDSDDAVNAYLRVKNLNDQEFINSHYVLFCTKNGVIKKTLLEQYSRPRQNGVNAITIREDDRVIEVRMTNGDNEIIIANRNGRAIRFHESAVRVMGRTATGVRGMTLDEDGQDEVVGMICIKDPEAETIMVVSEQGYGKRSDIEDYRKTNRGGKGVKTMNITDKTGKLVTIKSVTDENDLMIINKSGITIRLKVADVRIMGRATQGVRLINLEKRNDEIGSVCKVTSENEEELIEEGEENTLESPQNEVNNENEE